MSLQQLLDLIKNGNVLVIHTTQAMRAFTKDIDSLDIDNQTVCYYDCNYLPGLLDNGEWEWYLTQPEENSEIMDKDIRKRLAEQTTVPKKKYYTSG